MGRVGADGETGDFKGLMLSNSGPVFLGSRGFFFGQGADRLSAPTRDGPGLAGRHPFRRSPPASFTKDATDSTGVVGSFSKPCVGVSRRIISGKF